jgi:hypothetical protein
MRVACRQLYRVLTIVFYLILSACGGGGGGDTVTGGGNQSPTGPVIEAFVSDLVLEPVLHITPTGSSLYLGTGMGLVEIDRSTGNKRTIAGNTYIRPAGGWEQEEMDFAQVLSGDTAYMGKRIGRIGSVSVGQDSATAFELIVPQGAFSRTVYPISMAANSTHLFWTNGNQVFSQSHEQPISDQSIRSFSGGGWVLAASDEAVYWYLDGGSAAPNNFRRVYRYIIATGQTTLLYDQPRATTDITSVLPIAADATGVYWANGAEILYASIGSSSGQTVTTLSNRVISMVADSTGLYVYHIENYAQTVPNPAGRNVITKVTTGPLATTELVRLVSDSTESLVFTLESGEFYFAAHQYNGSTWATTLYHLNGSGGFDTLVHATQDYGLLGAMVLVASNGKLALASSDDHSRGAQLLLYDINTTAAIVVRPATRAVQLVRGGSKIFMSGDSGNVGISSLDLSLSLRQVHDINSSDPVGGFMPYAGSQAGGYVYLYGVYGADPSTYWRIVKMLPDGSQYQTLVQGTGELRDPVVIGDKLYYLCHTDCGDPGWVLASISVTGGSPTPETVVLDEPHLYAFNNILYLVGTPDGQTGDIFGINIATGEVALVQENVPYSTLTLTFSNSWLYWGGYKVLPDGAPARAVARQPWISWDKVGKKETLVEGTHEAITGLREFTISAANNYLYYWHDGLKRIAH